MDKVLLPTPRVLEEIHAVRMIQKHGRTSTALCSNGALGALGRWESLLSSGEATDQWIGSREILNESPIFNGKIYGFRFRFSLKPIH